MHFHPHQEEYIKVLDGTLGVEVETAEYKLESKDGEFLIKPWANHRLYPIISSDGDRGKTTRFLLSGEQSLEAFQLDNVFFQNWYGYQDQVVMSNGKFDLLQVMNVSCLPYISLHFAIFSMFLLSITIIYNLYLTYIDV